MSHLKFTASLDRYVAPRTVDYQHYTKDTLFVINYLYFVSDRKINKTNSSTEYLTILNWP